MINFRFHVVSIVAVFLALAIGVVFGSTIVDQAIVDGLRADVRSTERKVAETEDANEQLKSDLERWERYFESTAPFAVDGRLEGDDVVLLAERGVDGDLVDATRALLSVGAADSVVLVWLEDKLADDESADALGELVGTSSSDPVVVRAAAYDAIVEGLVTVEQAAGSDAPDEPASDESDASAEPTLDALADDDFVEIVDDPTTYLSSPLADRRVVLLAGSDTDFAALDELAEIAGAFDAAGVEIVVGEEFVAPPDDADDAPGRGARLQDLTGGDLAEAVSTVDNLDEIQGQVSLVVALADLRRDRVGHYGFGSGATRSAPEWSAT
jgi:hypothetical protein